MKRLFVLMTFKILVCTTLFSTNPLAMADSLYSNAYKYQNMGRYQDAEVLHRRALDIRLQYCDSSSMEISKSYRHMGNLYRDMGRYSEAEYYLSNAISIAPDSMEYAKSTVSYCAMLIDVAKFKKVDSLINIEDGMIYRVFGKQSTRYAAWLRSIGSFYCEKGLLDSALVYYEKAERIYINIDNKNSLASTFSNIADVYYDYGKYSQALDWARKGLIMRKDCFGNSSRPYASSLAQCGLCLYKMSRYTEAERNITEAMNIYKEVVGENHPDYAKTLHYMANIYQDQGQRTLAMKLHTKALEIKQNRLGEFHPEVLRSYNNLANLYRDLGDYHNSELLHLKVLKTRQNQLGHNNILCAKSLNNLGALYLEMGDYTKAKNMFDNAAKIFAKELGEGNARYTTTLNNLANVFLQSNQLDSARTIYEHIEHIYRNVLSDTLSLSYARILGKLGIVYQKNEKYNSSLAYLQKAYKLQSDKKNYSMASTLLELAEVYLEMNDTLSARTYADRALIAYKSFYALDNPNYIYAERKIARIHYLAKNKQHVLPLLMKSDSLARKSVLNYFMFMSESQRDSYWYKQQEYYYTQLPSYIYSDHSAQGAIIAYNNELFCKGILLNTSNQIKRSIYSKNDTLLNQTYTRLVGVNEQLIFLKQQIRTSRSVIDSLDLLADSLDKQIMLHCAQYKLLNMSSISWENIRKNLLQDEVAIEYFSAPLSEDSTMYCALLLRHNSEYPELIPLFEEKEITTFLFAESGNITNKTYNFYANGDTIYQLVWSKIQTKLKEGETIYFAPSGLLHQLAIEYLSCDENRTMSDVYNMVRLSSTRELITNKSQTDYTTATIYGGIQYDLDADNLLAESERYAKEDLLASRGIENDTLNRGNVQYLPGTKKEAETINTLLKENQITAKLYTSSKANEESFKSLSGKHNNIIHIGTHGFTWTDSVAKKQDYFTQRFELLGEERDHSTTIDPLTRCGLLFAGSNIALSGHSSELPEGVQDGILTAKEISLMDLRDADLVVLSACETAKGDITSEGVFGLQRAFKMAGVQTIIMSLWKVNDQATQLLMTEFYNNWIGKHQSKREAFRNAQNTVRTQYEEPEYWAGFIMLD